ncbi:MAG TPA: PAS domain-containing sensor histidine kinase [Candidatus Acidoferrales bacterium]|nr:PAS domain-containing sensor histidine kinase [Candidatus Acidoferrales bacterium]
MTEPHKAASPVRIDRPRGIAVEQSDLFRLLVENIRDYAVFVLDPEGKVLTWNPGAQALKGYTRDEIVGVHFSKFYLPEAVASGWPERELLLARKEGRFADEGWRVRKDGTSFWASVIITALVSPGGNLVGFAKVTQDLTDRRQAEERVQGLNRELRQRVTELDQSRRAIELRTLELQKLSARLLVVQDEERRRIARELHDDLGQQLSALKMVLAKGGGNDQALQITDTAISSVRNLSYLLHPPLLDETGLRSALHWYIDGMVKRSGIQVSLTITPQIFPRLAKDVEMTIFRVVQESLTNVYRHANSDSARVEIDKQPEWVTIRVRDYGKGLPQDVIGKRSSSLGVGITGMRERVRQFGGELTLSRAEPGTLVETKIPLFSSAIDTYS